MNLKKKFAVVAAVTASLVSVSSTAWAGNSWTRADGPALVRAVTQAPVFVSEDGLLLAVARGTGVSTDAGDGSDVRKVTTILQEQRGDGFYGLGSASAARFKAEVVRLSAATPQLQANCLTPVRTVVIVTDSRGKTVTKTGPWVNALQEPACSVFQP